MSSVIEQLARRLDTSPGRARQRLQTLLTALRSRIERNGEASLPGLGTFSRAEGAWTFEPDEALARSVNHSFEDLDAVSVPAPDAGDAAAASSTPQEAAPREETASAEEESSGEDAPAGEEDLFAGLSFDDSSPRESSDAPGDAVPSAEPSPEAASSPPAAEQREDDTGSDWAFPDPSAGASGSTAAWSYAALPAGASLVRRRTVAPSPGDVRAGRLETEDAAAPRTEDAPGGHRAEGWPREERPSRTPEPSTDRTRPPESERRTTSSDSGSGLGGWLAALAVLLVVGLGGWFVLGQQGVAPGPVATLQQGGGSGNAPSEASTGAPGSRSGAAAAADSAAADTAGSTTADSTTEEARAYAQAGRLDRAEGGWTVVVASEISRDTARRAAQQFARQFQDQDYPIDILEATVDGTPRYRVVVGQFSSREAAAQPLQRDGGPFPQGAWTLQVEPAS
jgi:hypothetical protein